MRCTTDACSISATSRSRPPQPPTYQVQTGWGTYQIHAILATEEMSKIPALIACLDELDKREQPKWDDIAEFLRSHDWKLMMNELYFATQRSATGLDATGSKQWQEALKAAKNRNTRKQSGFYVTINAGVLTTPAVAVDKEHAKFALGLARITFNMMELVNRAFTLRQHNPKAPVESFRYSLLDRPLVDN